MLLLRNRAARPQTLAIVLIVFAISLRIGHAQDALTPPETAELVVSATRIPTSEDETPASVTVITADDFSIHQTERVADALRSVPGLSVVQSGTAGQLTSVFTRGLRSEHTQVLIDGVPINQGLAGLFNFADLAIDSVEEVRRGAVIGLETRPDAEDAHEGILKEELAANAEATQTIIAVPAFVVRSSHTSPRLGLHARGESATPWPVFVPPGIGVRL